MKIELRKAEIKDVNEILGIVNYEILNSTVLYDYLERTFEQQLKWFEQKQADGMRVWHLPSSYRRAGFEVKSNVITPLA